MRIVAALMMVVLLVGPAQAEVTPPREGSITVSGEGQVSVPPEFAQFFADVVTRAESLEAATRQHTERVAKAVSALRGMTKLGVSIERSSFHLQQNRLPARQAGPKQAIEYRAVTSFVVKVDQLGTLNDAVSAIAAAGLFEVRAIRYSINNEERAIDDARRAAVKSARHQAEVYADAAGVKLGDILEIFDGIAQNLGSEAALPATTPNVQVAPPATIPFRATINIKWRIVPQP